MRVQLAWTMLAELAVMICSVLLLKLAADLLGLAGFGEYVLSRRAVGLLYLPLMMGLGIAVPRYIAIMRAGGLPGYSERSFALAGLIGGAVPALAAILVLNAAPAASATALFGTDSLRHLVPPASVAVAGLVLHSLVYAIYRGRSEMGFANAVQVANIGVLPVAVFFCVPLDAASVLGATGIAWLIISGIAATPILLRDRPALSGVVSARAHVLLLVRYGLPRIPGEFALAGLFAIPALIAVRTQGVEEAGQFSAAMSLLALGSGAFTPVGLVVLPRASAQAATGDTQGLRRLVSRILAGGILLVTAGVIVGEIVMPPFIRWYFGAEFLPAIPVFRACLLGAIPYVIYLLLRNILDALDVRAVNSRNVIITLVLLVVLCLLRPGLLWMSFSLVASLTLLGALSVRDTYSRLGRLLTAPASPVTPGATVA